MKHIAWIICITVLISCKETADKQNTKEAGSKHGVVEESEGIVECSVIVTSPDSNDIRTFYEFNPAKTEMYFKGDHFKLVEYGGLSAGNILLNNADYSVYQLDTMHKIAYRGVYSDLASANAQVKELMPDHYEPTVEETGETEIILGYTCKKLKVTRSGFVRANGNTYMWVTDSIIFPPARYDIETDFNKVITPVPMLIGYRNGTVMRLTYMADSMEVKYEITRLTLMPLQDSVFEIPSDYEIQ